MCVQRYDMSAQEPGARTHPPGHLPARAIHLHYTTFTYMVGQTPTRPVLARRQAGRGTGSGWPGGRRRWAGSAAGLPRWSCPWIRRTCAAAEMFCRFFWHSWGRASDGEGAFCGEFLNALSERTKKGVCSPECGVPPRAGCERVVTPHKARLVHGPPGVDKTRGGC
jgi:hypothetical protein